jgi:hypothetical protein
MWPQTTALLIGGAAGVCSFLVLQLLARRHERSTAPQINSGAGPRPGTEDDCPHETHAKTETGEFLDSPKEWWVNAEYFWIVLCKNEQFHRRANPLHAHRIPLGQTDTVSRLPVSKPFQVRCDSCGKEYIYTSSEVMRWEMEAPESFDPHPLFRD